LSNPGRPWGALLPVVGGLIVAGAALAALAAGGRPEAKPGPAIGPRPTLAAAQTDAATCASCHPGQAAEWQRSVMAYAAKSPLYGSLESLIEEQFGRDASCPQGAGVLRKADPARACRGAGTGLAVTGAGGEHWCVNCHSPAEVGERAMPAWQNASFGGAETRRPARDLLGPKGLEGISCGFCHQAHGPVSPRAGAGAYQGNASWTSPFTGTVFAFRPEDTAGRFGIGNSGVLTRPSEFLSARPLDDPPFVHARPSPEARDYLRDSSFCGGCHDVRLFGTDVIGAAKGEHFKRLRNAYTEWSEWARDETRAGRRPASCQGCHMTTYPGVCEPGEGDEGEFGASPSCPPGTHVSPRAPGDARGGVVHYFTGVDLPFAAEFSDALGNETGVDPSGLPTGARYRRNLLLRSALAFKLERADRQGSVARVPVVIENVGAGHRVPAGFSQEREIWVHLTVKDRRGRVVYEVGRVDRPDEDLHDKEFVRINADPSSIDAQGRPVGVFGADVRDGRDVPLWQRAPAAGGVAAAFRGRGLVNFQNGFLRCVRCIGTVGPGGECLPLPGQEGTRSARFDDGAYDADTGECRSNLSGDRALFEIYLPVGALDASRGGFRGPDAIVDTRSLAPKAPVRYTYEVPAAGADGPLRVSARLLFRAFPPYLIRAFAAYEREQARRGLRPSGPLVTDALLGRLDVVELARAEAEVP
jgi:eukaryotic-like serine/threonine-protein kinase